MKNYIIHLPRIEASLATAQVLFQKLQSYGADVELFEGTYGNDAVQMMKDEGRRLHPWGIKGSSSVLDESLLDPNDKLLRPGVRGCFYSHYRLWLQCVKLNEPIIIFEDDIALTRPYQPVDWDDVLIVALGHQNKSARYWHYLDTPEGEPCATDYFQTSMPGCCGYAIKPHAARKLVEVYENTYLPADNAISVYHVKIQIHNYIMGRALVKADGKRSLTTSTEAWIT